jgi:heme-degrading monooxygenase HmoA
MFVQVVMYSLDGITEEQYLDVANQLAGRTANLPGLLAKVWLENEGSNRYGAIYFWEDEESMVRFADTDLFEGRAPEFEGLRIEEFKVLERLTAATQPVLEILQPTRLGGGPEASRASGAAAIESAPTPPTPRQPVAKKRTPPPAKSAKAAKSVKPATKARATSASKGPAKRAAKT